jgi:sugar lactone lactonase YvrE
MSARISEVHPAAASEGGRLTITGEGFPVADQHFSVTLGATPVRPLSVRATRLKVVVPPGLPAGPTTLHLPGISGDEPTVVIGGLVATGLHQVDNPVFDAQGRLYVTFSGSRGQQVPVSIFRIARDGARESLVTGMVNATSLAIGPDGMLYVSSRFEGIVYRVDETGQAMPLVTDVGVACGIAFDADGTMFIGDRSGTIFRVRQGTPATMMATLPASVAAFHLAMGPDRCLYVTAPTLTTRDPVYRVQLNGTVDTPWTGFGRPQGLAYGPDGLLYVVEALSGSSGLYRLRPNQAPELVIAGEGLVGVAFDPQGGVVLTSNDAAWRFDECPA